MELAPQYNPTKPRHYHDYGTHLFLKEPTVSIFDPDGRLPLNLARNNVQSPAGDLEVHLVDDLCRNFIAHCLIRGPKGPIFSGTNSHLYLNTLYPGLPERTYPRQLENCLFFSTRDGFGLSDPWNISHFASQAGLVVRSNGASFQVARSITQFAIAGYGLTLPVEANGTLGEFDTWHRRLALSPTELNESLSIFRGLNVKGVRILMPTKWYERFIDKQPRFVVELLQQVESKIPDWVIMALGECTNTDACLVSLAEELQEKRMSIESATEFYLSAKNVPPKPGRIAQMWKDTVGDPVIPFDKDKREKIVAGLDERFRNHLAEWKE